jgi:Cu-Zn family superoxide dismutase
MRSAVVAIAAAVVASMNYSFAAESKSFKMNIINTNQQEVGEVTLTETPNGVLIRIELRENPPGISPGPHALHIHEVGKCEPPFKSAGEHFNPLKKRHGFLDEQGKHLGDLPNIHIVANAPTTAEFSVPQLSLDAGNTAVFGSDGSALVIHESADDYRTDPAGMRGIALPVA